MKPWPKALQERYPCHPLAVPSRPWWRIEGPVHVEYMRTDAYYVQEYQGFWALYVLDRVADMLNYPPGHPSPFKSPEEAMAFADECFTLPHPGVRVAQAWASESGGAVQIVSMDANGHLIACVDDTHREPRDSKARTGYNLRPVLVNFQPDLYPYLVADPCCPHLAPWSPS